MSEEYFDAEQSFDDYQEEQMSCDYGFEFCGEPSIKAMGLCTTECSIYLEACEEMMKGENE